MSQPKKTRPATTPTRQKISRLQIAILNLLHDSGGYLKEDQPYKGINRAIARQLKVRHKTSVDISQALKRMEERGAIRRIWRDGQTGTGHHPSAVELLISPPWSKSYRRGKLPTDEEAALLRALRNLGGTARARQPGEGVAELLAEWTGQDVERVGARLEHLQTLGLVELRWSRGVRQTGQTAKSAEALTPPTPDQSPS